MPFRSIILAAVASLALFSCKNIFQLFDVQAYGSISVRATRGDGFGAKTLRPSSGDLAIATYNYHLVGPGGITVDGSDSAGAKTFADLIVGSWNVTVTAKNALAVTLLSSAAVGFTVSQGQTASVVVPLTAGTETGTVSITLTLPAFVTQVTGTIEDNANPGTPIDINAKIAFTSPTAVYSDTRLAGTYLLVLKLYNGIVADPVGMVIEDLDVFDGITTSVTVPVSTESLNQAPTAPGGLNVDTPTLSGLSIHWDTLVGATSYQLYRDTSSGGSFSTKIFDGAALSYNDTGLSAETIYYYKAGATNPFGESALSDAVSAATSPVNVFVTINAAGDSFQMGDGTYGPQPNATQTISYNYDIGKYEITNAQFAAFIADGGYSTASYWTTNGWSYKQAQGWTQPNYWTNSSFNRNNQPVLGVSWYEAIAYCNWRSTKESLTSAYASSGQANLSANGYRLPTEVEWEYAAAKGAPGQSDRLYAWGDDWDAGKAVCKVSPANATAPMDVGSKSPAGDTPLGLCDITGNTWEWCNDNYQADGSVAGGTDRYFFIDDLSTTAFMLRDDHWNNTASWYYRTALRQSVYPHTRASYGPGLRLVRCAATPVPTAPSGLSATTISTTSIRLAWTDNSSNEAGFKIERSPNGSSGWTEVGTTASSVATFDDTGLSSGTMYYYRVWAWNGGGNSVYSNTASAITYP